MTAPTALRLLSTLAVLAVLGRTTDAGRTPPARCGASCAKAFGALPPRTVPGGGGADGRSSGVARVVRVVLPSPYDAD